MKQYPEFGSLLKLTLKIRAGRLDQTIKSIEIKGLVLVWLLIIMNLILKWWFHVTASSKHRPLVDFIDIAKTIRSQSYLAVLVTCSSLGRHLCFQCCVSLVEDIRSIHQRPPMRSSSSFLLLSPYSRYGSDLLSIWLQEPLRQRQRHFFSQVRSFHFCMR